MKSKSHFLSLAHSLSPSPYFTRSKGWVNRRSIDRLKARAGSRVNLSQRRPFKAGTQFCMRYSVSVCMCVNVYVCGEGVRILLYPTNSALFTPLRFHKQLALLLNIMPAFTGERICLL